jgi:hypothetical protein
MQNTATTFRVHHWSEMEWQKCYIYLYIPWGVQCLPTGWTIRFQFPTGAEDFSSSPCVSGLALGPTQPPVQWVSGVLSLGVKRGRGVTLTAYPHLVPRLCMSRSYTSSPLMHLRSCSGIALHTMGQKLILKWREERKRNVIDCNKHGEEWGKCSSEGTAITTITSGNRTFV